MGGSHIEYGLVREDGLVAAASFGVKQATLERVLPELEAGVRSLIAEQGMELRQMAGVAVGICAVVDETGSVRAVNGKYDDGVGFNFGRWSESRFGLRGKAENDTRLALLGERFAGAAKGWDDAVLVTLGTGIGGAVIVGGRLLRSGSNKAGSLAGHLGVDWRGRVCTCGNRGCAEAEASTVALDAICRERAGFARSSLANVSGAIDFYKLFEGVAQGDSLAREVLDHCIGVWSALAVTLVHAYDPQVIVFGGGVMKRQELILPAVRDHVDRYAWAEKGSVRIVPSSLGASAALLGAWPLLEGEA